MGRGGVWPAWQRHESNNDQAALHHLYVNRSRVHELYRGERPAAAARAPMALRVDAAARFSAQLWTCKGGADGGPARHFRSGSKGFEYCHETSWAPLERLEPARGGRTLTFNASRFGGSVRPWMVHSNGYHFVLKSPVLAPIMRRYEGYPPRLLAHPVLLVDGGHVTCEVTTLGNLMNLTSGGSDSDE